jgi:hypothetical protein
MKKIIIIVTLLALSIGTFSCGGGSGSSSSPHGENPGLPSVVQLRSSHNVAQTNATVYLHARILDGNGVPVKNEPVTFTNLSEPFGVIKTVLRVLGLRKPVGVLSDTVVKTDNLGIATVKLTSTTSGFATIQAEVNGGAGQVRDKKTVFFSVFSLVFPSIPIPSPTLFLDVDTTVTFSTPDESGDFILFKTTGDNQRFIRATVLNSSGLPVSGSIVTFGSDSTDLTYENGANEIAKITDINGQVTTSAMVNPAALSQTVRTINFTAVADNGTSNVLTLFLEPVVIDGSASSLSALPTTVVAGGTSTLTANVKINTGGAAPDNTSVNFTTTCGAVDSFGQTTDGIANATFTAPATVPSGGVCTVSGKVAGITIGSAPITIQPTLAITLNKLNVIGEPNPDSSTSDNVTFTVSAGVPPYVVECDNSALMPGGPWTLATSGSFATTDANSVGATTAVTFTVHDNAGTTATATLTIFPQAQSNVLTLALDKMNVIGIANPDADTSDNVTFTVTGGVAPYVVESNNFALTPGGSWPLATSGATAATDLNSVGATTEVTFTVYDNVGTTATAVLAIFPKPGNALTIALNKLNVLGLPNPDASTSDNVTLTVTGGVPPYVVQSSNATLTPGGTWPFAISGATAVTDVNSVGATTEVTFTVHDNAGSTPATATLNIYPQTPLAITLDKLNVIGIANPDAGPADNVTFTVTGGVPPYVVESNNLALTPGGPWSLTTSGSTAVTDVNSVGATTPVTFTVRDNEGTSATSPTLDVFAQTNTNALTIALDKLNVVGLPNPDGSITDNVTLTVTGGMPPYTVTSINPALTPNGTWSLTTSGSTAATDVNNVGATTAVTFTVNDNAGSTPAAATLNIYPQKTGLIISVNKPDVIGLANGACPSIDGSAADDITFTVTGGTPPYIISAAGDNAFFCLSGPWLDNVGGTPITIDPDAGARTVTLTVTDAHGAITITTVGIHP